MNEKFTFDDVLIEPSFNTVSSRKDVDLSTKIGNIDLKLPVISANMDTVTEVKMAQAMHKHGGIGCLHRFSSVDESVFMAGALHNTPFIASIGLSDVERMRAKRLYGIGVRNFCIDVAHGASVAVVIMMDWMYETFGKDVTLIVGNFASSKSLNEFLKYSKNRPSAIKVGVGPGSACTTRIKTGCGYPQLSAVQDMAELASENDIAVIADGGMKTPGDIAKALAAGADAVMLGGMLAGTDETPGEVKGMPGEVDSYGNLVVYQQGPHKIYKGSASKESYKEQGKMDSWRTAEGKQFTVSYKGPVSNVLQDIEGGLRSAFTYVGAKNLTEFWNNATFIKVSPSTKVENGAHGEK